MEKRISKAVESINTLNISNKVIISNDYARLKLEELRLTHEHKERLKAEREQAADERRAAREEERLQRELDVAEAEEVRFARKLDRARQEAQTKTGPQLNTYLERIRILEEELAEAQEKTRRAVAMASQTKTGHVYIISNVGSFGDNIVKIGLTRRLDPLDRVRELGDASVPFSFDVHAIIYSEDAPSLERALHSRFENSRINTQNPRKEFFQVNLNEVEEAVKALAPEADFFRDIEAQEYHESLARRSQALAASQVISLPVHQAVQPAAPHLHS